MKLQGRREGVGKAVNSTQLFAASIQLSSWEFSRLALNEVLRVHSIAVTRES